MAAQSDGGIMNNSVYTVINLIFVRACDDFVLVLFHALNDS